MLASKFGLIYFLDLSVFVKAQGGNLYFVQGGGDPVELKAPGGAAGMKTGVLRSTKEKHLH